MLTSVQRLGQRRGPGMTWQVQVRKGPDGGGKRRRYDGFGWAMELSFVMTTRHLGSSTGLVW
jgi:hypothetical protein